MPPTPTCCVADLVKAVAAIAPPALAEEWDNVGLQVGHPSARVRRVMTCLELSEATLAEARERQADAVLAHHPLIFKPLTSLNLAQPAGALVAGLVQAGIALIAAHTNLDAAAWSTNTVLAETCGWPAGEPLFLRLLAEDAPPTGLGVLLELPGKTELAVLIGQVKQRLGLRTVRLSGPETKKVRRIALCTGSGGSFIGPVAARADLYVTGEINYHQAMEARQRGLPVIEIGHFESEVLIAAPLAARLAAWPRLAEAGVEVFHATRDFQPFRTE